MAKYNVTYACGHVAEKQLYGPMDDRQRYLAWAARSANCPSCRQAGADQAISDIEAEHELPALTGSEKQAKWGREIRAEKIAGVVEFVQKNRPATMTDEQATKFDQQYSAVMQLLYGRTEAGWWIDRRSAPGQEIAKAAFAETRR
ncbi:MAG: hypothetical protein J0H82_26415 [Alphaproteobacteria bacterium]|jgi:hypothetical protein|nr:hypothetical protein [Alphaproteobacteria bacterium]